MGPESPKFGPPETPEEERELEGERSRYMLEHIKIQDKLIAQKEEQLGIDHLTGLKNRKVFEHELKRMLHAIERDGHNRPGGEALEKMALLFIDLDNFKSVNDKKGHLEGDGVLVKVAEILKRAVRDSDVVARFGGDEFYILLPRADEQAAIKIADEIHADLEGDAKLRELGVTASIGVRAVDISTLADPETLIHEVDIAMLKAKQGGKKQTEIHQ